MSDAAGLAGGQASTTGGVGATDTPAAPLPLVAGSLVDLVTVGEVLWQEVVRAEGKGATQYDMALARLAGWWSNNGNAVFAALRLAAGLPPNERLRTPRWGRPEQVELEAPVRKSTLEERVLAKYPVPEAQM